MKNKILSLIFGILLVSSLLVGCLNIKKVVASVSIYSEPVKTEYSIGEDIDLKGAVLKIEFANGSIEYVNANAYCDVSKIDMSVIGEKQIECVYKYLNEEYKVYFRISVKNFEDTAQGVFESMVDKAKDIVDYRIQGNLDKDENILIQYKETSQGLKMLIEESSQVYYFDINKMYVNFSETEKYKLSDVSYSEFLTISHFEMGNETIHPLELIISILKEGNDDIKQMETTQSGYKITFKHINNNPIDGPSLPSGDVELILDNNKRLLSVNIEGDMSYNISFGYNESVNFDTQQHVEKNKHFISIKKAVENVKSKSKWDFYLIKEDGPENYYYEKSGDKEYFAYKRIHYHSNTNDENCYYFYEDGVVYYYDANQENVAYKWNNVEEAEFMNFVGSGNKLNFLKDILDRFNINSLENTIDYKECYTVDRENSAVHHQSFVYGAYGQVNIGDSNDNPERKYIVMEIDGGSQLRNIYIYNTKEDAMSDINYSETTGEIDGWGAQKGNRALINLSIGFYQENLPTHSNILSQNGINVEGIIWQDKSGTSLSK